VEVFTSDDDGVGHFGGVNDTGKDTSSDGNVTGEGALLVDVGSVDGLWEGLAGVAALLLVFHRGLSLNLPLPSDIRNILIFARSSFLIQYTRSRSWQLTRWGLEAKTDVLVPSLGLGGDLLTTYFSK
jgi:hypothetical protein